MEMDFLASNLDTLVICATLTVLAALVTIVCSVLCGATLAYYARPNFRYGAMLALLFVPFALGGSVWAYSVTRFFSLIGIQSGLLETDTFTRALVLLLLNLARTIPLGAFFCATTLHRPTSEMRPYLRIHHLHLPFFLGCSINRIPKSIMMLLGLFGGALMASEAALPQFLYRANPGTGPETVNILLSREFREVYATMGPLSSMLIAIMGLVIAAALILSAILGTTFGQFILKTLQKRFMRRDKRAGTGPALLSRLLRVASILVLTPGILAILGLILPYGSAGYGELHRWQGILDYNEIVAIGLAVGLTITILSIMATVRLRYTPKDWLKWMEESPVAATVLLMPAFFPVLTIVAALGSISGDMMKGISGYIALFVSHALLHFPIFAFISISVIANIPENHVAWQRSMRMSYRFSVMTDGFKRNAAIVASLVGLCIVQVVSDSSVARWFSNLVKSPEEALSAAVFGRLASAPEAEIITWTIATVALFVCAILATAYVKELRSRPRYA